MRKSMLPDGGQNKFQKIKEKIKAARNAGIRIVDLSVGQPRGSAYEIAKKAASISVMSADENIHSYQDNSCSIEGFSKSFAEAHMKRELLQDEDSLPIPGIKSTLYVIPMACGSRQKLIKVATMTRPGYPTPEDACKALKNVWHYPVRLNSQNKFLFDAKEIKKGTTLLMTNFPNNPTGQTATKGWWRKILKYCEKHNIRVFNDAAYTMLASKRSCTLAEISPEFPNLSWAEAYSASKIGNFTGWRIGLIVGSSDFVQDIRTEKGNFDSGFVAFAAAGILVLIKEGQDEIEACRRSYLKKQRLLVKILTKRSMKIVLRPKATFFSFWHVPRKAFGQRIENAEEFNNLMIERTGVAGVPFDLGYIRYCVTGDIQKNAKLISAAFQTANVSYR